MDVILFFRGLACSVSSDVILNATKGGMARVVEASVFALMVAVVIMLLVHVTVLQDGRYLLFTEDKV